MPTRALKPTLSRRFKSVRCSLHPFYRGLGKYGMGHAVFRSASIPVIDARIMVSLRNRYIFVRVPKCANTTVLTTLWLCENGYDLSRLDQVAEQERRQMLRKQSMKKLFLSPSELSRSCAAVALESFRKCIIVRNPFSRVASAYMYRFVNGSGADELGLPRKLDFKAFCDFLAERGLYTDIHWMPQAHVSPFRPEQMDFVGRMESLAEDLNRLTQCIYGLAAPVLTRQSHATGAAKRLRELYGARQIEQIRELYADDFREFGYSLDPF